MSMRRAVGRAAMILAAGLGMGLCGCDGGSGTAEAPPRGGEAKPASPSGDAPPAAAR